MTGVLSVTPLQENRFKITVSLPDTLGLLSLITGLFSSYGIAILRGHIRTVGKSAEDIFEVQTAGQVDWEKLERDLSGLSQKIRTGKQTVQSLINDRIIDYLRKEKKDWEEQLAPISLQVHQDLSPSETVVDIEAQDTPAFLYELTNALSLLGINIVRMEVETKGETVQDRLWVTVEDGQKITSEKKLKALQWAVLLMKQFTHLLPRVPDPKSALDQVTLFGKDLFERDDFTQVLLTLKDAEVMKNLSRVIGSTRYLWEAFIRSQHESIFPILTDLEVIKTRKSREQMAGELKDLLLSRKTFEEKEEAFNEYKDREIFRIDLRHILGKASYLGEFAEEFSDLAEAVLEAAGQTVWEECCKAGSPPKISETEPSEYTVFALGKFGGRELGYASDLELMVLYSDDPDSSNPRSQENLKFYSEFVRRLNRMIHARVEGVFEIDLRLRPFGKDGPLASSTAAFKNYYRPGGDAWDFERQALIKLRFVAGSEKLGREICAARDKFVYSGEPFDFEEAVKLRKRQREELVKKGFNAKLSAGGLVDIEYLVQVLQIAYGRHQTGDVRNPNTLTAMRALWQAGALDEKQFQLLRAAYLFLRSLINALRMVRGNAKDLAVPKEDSKEFVILGRRIGYRGTDEEVRKKFQSILERHRNIAESLYESWMKELSEKEWNSISLNIQAAAQPVLRVSLDDLLKGGAGSQTGKILQQIGFRNVPEVITRFQRICPNALVFEPFALVMDQAWQLWPEVPDPDLALTHLSYFVESVPDLESFWAELSDSAEGLAVLLKLFGSSRYLSKTLISNPEYWNWVREPKNFDIQNVEKTLRGLENNTELELLRTLRHRETLRIALAEWFDHASVDAAAWAFSLLADSVIGILFGQMIKDQPISVLALGKWGGEELNFSSDVDLMFLSETEYAPDSGDRAVQAFLNQMKSGSLEEFLYRTDLRLRPHGDKGTLCMGLEDALAYYEKEAEDWEFQVLIKARVAAGIKGPGQAFLQKMAPEIYRKSWSAEQIENLRTIKRRYEERTQSEDEWERNVKMGYGTIRDAEFSAQFLQLQSGHRIPELRSHRTLTALDRLHQHQLLKDNEYAALKESYLFFRKIENRLQLYENRQVFNLPTEPAELQVLAKNLGFRDADGKSAREQFQTKCSKLKQECRNIFERIFYGK